MKAAACTIQDVADYLGHKNIQNTTIYAQITTPLCEQHPKTMRITEGSTVCLRPLAQCYT
jgi:hypothetical protein